MRIQFAIPLALAWIAACGAEAPPQESATPGDEPEPTVVEETVVPFGGYQFYYVDGLPKGATYDLLQRLESYINKELGRRNIKVYVVVIPVSRDELIPAMLNGHADLVAGDLTITPERSALVSFARPMLRDIDEVIVTGPGAPPIESLDDLAEQEIVVLSKVVDSRRRTSISRTKSWKPRTCWRW
jgi:ABC-type amino acid transport substrate-binding protein